MELRKIERVLTGIIERTMGPNMLPRYHAGEPNQKDVEAVNVLLEIRAEIKASSLVAVEAGWLKRQG